MYYVKRISYSGYRIFGLLYPAPAIGNHSPKAPRSGPLTERQKQANQKRAIWRLQSLIMSNFVAGEDQFLTLTHKRGTSEAESEKAVRTFLAHLRDWHKQQGQKLRYIRIREKQGQWHHHLILSKTPLELIRKYWPGRLSLSPLDDSQGYFDLVQYLLAKEKDSRSGSGVNVKEPRRPNEKAWTCSQGLIQPEDQVRVLKNPPRGKIRPPKGYELLEGSVEERDSRFGRVITYQCQWIGSGEPEIYARTRKRSLAQRKLPARKSQPHKSERKKE